MSIPPSRKSIDTTFTDIVQIPNEYHQSLQHTDVLETTSVENVATSFIDERRTVSQDRRTWKRVLAKFTLETPVEDLEPPPDGGITAWTQGILNSFVLVDLLRTVIRCIIAYAIEDVNISYKYTRGRVDNDFLESVLLSLFLALVFLNRETR